ncbi:sulfite exporter TauE/SafE family protein [Flavobacterium silvisoli]|uniref:Probable membrane transporter protein n=1 Tax=Flavobacterium silvisoli TaxID=2529433 RepID=A0A4Q9Z4U2_9FLAO|nr:sulfite exporter TauE/SafE family protein [Flavobacterium silvisoli]TBX70396.1 sulfite exporter TauE/SafE family protein [Flavobacterium silvisoli]
MDGSTVLILVFVGVLAGMLSGLIGIGGGIIIVPMLLFIGLTQQQAQGTSLAVMLPPIAFLAVLNYHKAGQIEWKYAMIIAVFFIIGSYYGSKIAINIDQKTLRKIFGVVLLIIAGKMLLTK